MSQEQRLIFGEVAELYDRSRPSYPLELVEDVLHARAPHLPALEVGAGTGRATLLFMGRVSSLVALEPSPEMAAVLTQRVAAQPEVTVVASDFEAYQSERCRFGLIFSAQAWHWLDAGRRAARAAELLAPGGLLAAFWNRPVWGPGPLRDDLGQLLANREPNLLDGAATDPQGGERADMFEAWNQEASATGRLEESALRRYSWSTTYTRSAYLDLLRTQSPYRMLGPPRMEALLAEIGALVDRHGGEFELPHVTWLCLARRSRLTPR